MPTILCVDDDTVILAALQEILSPHYRVLLTRSGNEAIELAERDKPDLILLDIGLEDIDGFEVLKKIRSFHQKPSIPVIFVTSNLDAKREQDAFDHDASDFIRKPLMPMQLKARVQNQLTVYAAQKALLEQEKYEIYRAMAQSTQHILNNFLNQMILFQLTANKVTNFPEDVKTLIGGVINDTARKVAELSNVQEITPENIRKTVFPK
jgi:DNA-binding response OmpR family regulator